MMLVIAPQLVRQNLIAQLQRPTAREVIRNTVLSFEVTWPWTTQDGRIADTGVIGDARAASAELGQRILDHAVDRAVVVLAQLLEGQ